MNNQTFQETFDQGSFYSNILGSENYLSHLKGESNVKGTHTRSQSLFSAFDQSNAINNAIPFTSSSLINDNLSMNQQIKGNNILGVNSSLLSDQDNDYSNIGGVESSLTRERPIGAGHRYNSHSMNFLPLLNQSSMMNSNTSTSWGNSALQSNQMMVSKGNQNPNSMNPLLSMNRMDINDNGDVAADLLNTVAADRLVTSQTTASHLSGMENNNESVSGSLATTLGMNKSLNVYNQDSLLNSNDLFKSYTIAGNKNLTSPLVDGSHAFVEERPSSVLSNRSNSPSNNIVPSPFLNTLVNSNQSGAIENELLKTSSLIPVNMLNSTTQANKSLFQRSPLFTHKPKSSSIHYLDLSPKTEVFSPNHRRGASLNIITKKLDKGLLNAGGVALDKNEKEDDEDSKLSLTLNTSSSSFSNEVILSPEIDNLPEIQQLENDEETLVESPTTLFVEYLDHSLSLKELKPYFSKFGEIESMKIDNDKDVAYVKYKNSKDASKAKNEMNGKMIKTSEIQISFHTMDISEETTSDNTPTKSLWIGNIPATLSPSELEKKFAKFGSIESARLLSHKTCGFINFEKLDDAIQAKEKMNGLEINGIAIKVSYAKVPPKSESHDSESTKSPTSPTSSEKTKEKKSKKELPHLTIPITTEYLKSFDNENDGEYFDTIPTLSDHLTKRQVDQNKLKEMRKKLEGHTTAKEIESYFNTIMLDVVGLCTDYIGNVIVQKVLDRTSDENRLKLIEKLSPNLATVGIHKNGTWVVQKIIDEAKGPVQIQYIVNGLKKYTPPLLLDQFGNYVIQCCLRLGTQNNQFIFDAIVARCKDIGPGRFGARAIRACLESQHTTKRQQKQVAMAIVRCATDLCVNPNGALLITWLLDTSSLPGRFRVIAPKLVPNIANFCCNKLASSTILKLVNQRVEMDARSTIIKSIFYQSDSILREILSNPAYGVSVIQKILSSACINNEEKIQLADRVRTALSQLTDIKPNQVGYKRLFEELGIIPTTKNNLNPSLFYNNTPIDIVSPLTPTTPMSSFFSNFINDPSQTQTPTSNNPMIPNMYMNDQQQQQQQQQILNNSFTSDSFNILQQQQQQQIQQQRTLDTFNFPNSYFSLLNNSPSLKFGQSQGFNSNNIFNNPLLSNEGSLSQFNSNVFQNNIFPQKQQINPYSLLMNGGSSSLNNYYSNTNTNNNNSFGNQNSSPNLNQNVMKTINKDSPSLSSSVGI
ncbi:hypothetical protein H8356DRAFT_930396 [Neocallimastix lanati (nom. inval.)]|jgi:RNA recognition motif-containing protein|nr:hypothetical protein H8356DRAFT_930396 [Neocallimastix sp. JGI-2020a]